MRAPHDLLAACGHAAYKLLARLSSTPNTEHRSSPRIEHRSSFLRSAWERTSSTLCVVWNGRGASEAAVPTQSVGTRVP